MTDRPIPFSAPMVRALLDGRKTQTRRVFKPRGFESFTHPVSGDRYNEYRPYRDGSWDESRISGGGQMRSFGWGESLYAYLPYSPGDRLWVKESYYQFGHWQPVDGQRSKGGRQKWAFMAESDEVLFAAPIGEPVRLGRHHKDPATSAWHKRLARFMPKTHSRLTLQVTDVRVERLQAISRGDAMEEGCPFPNVASGPNPCRWYAELWDEINGSGAWAANPWVAAYTFTVALANIDRLSPLQGDSPSRDVPRPTRSEAGAACDSARAKQ